MIAPRVRRLPALCGLLLQMALAPAADGQSIDLAKARQCFDEAAAIVDRDNGALWGTRTGGPLLFVDRDSRAVAASRAAAAGALVDSGGVFVGLLPEEVNIANTATSWNGVDWVMLIWPLPDDSLQRNILLAHEGWHAVQERIGLPASGAENAHLDEKDGRLWLQLEWKALEKALTTTSEERHGAVMDALRFRAKRYAIYPDAADEERDMELHEGMAEYTGMALVCGDGPQAAEHACMRLRTLIERKSLTRAFPYGSGPAYGLLLDWAAPEWRPKAIQRAYLQDLVAAAYRAETTPMQEEALIRRAEEYGYSGLLASETIREERRIEQKNELMRRFVDGPVLVLPLAGWNMSFDPGQVVPLGDHGMVYGNLRLTDGWGILETTAGGLMGASFDKAYVPAPTDPNARPLEGDGWQLQLAEGWSVVAGERPGDCTLVME